jgi:hypothetical protein
VFTIPDELGIRQASDLIDELKGREGANPGNNSNSAYAMTEGAR